MPPYFSIVVPYYNWHDIFPGTVAAVLQQQEADFELLLVDDGSQDQPLAVAWRLALGDSRVRVCDELFAELMTANAAFGQRCGHWVGYFMANCHTFATLTLALSKGCCPDTMRYSPKALRADPTVLWRRRFLALLKHLI